MATVRMISTEIGESTSAFRWKQRFWLFCFQQPLLSSHRELSNMDPFNFIQADLVRGSIVEFGTANRVVCRNPLSVLHGSAIR